MRMRVFLFAAAGLLFALAPVAVAAQTGGLVSCLGYADCNFCALSKLVQNIINFLIAVSIPISVALFAWAGWLYFSSAANPGQIETAKKIFTSVLIGFLIAIGGWLAVQTMLKVLLKDDVYRGWDNIQCDSRGPGTAPGLRQSGFSVGEWLNRVLNPLSPLRQDTMGIVYGECPAEYPKRQPESGECCVEGYTSCIPSPTRVTPASGTAGATDDDLAKRKFLEENGIFITSFGSCADKSNPTCTSADGLQDSSVGDMINFNKIIPINMSGGTEAGHAAKCQSAGLCPDVVPKDPSLMSTAEGVIYFIQEAKKIGRCPVFEPGPGGYCPAGVPKGSCQEGVGSAPHFSFYSC